MPKSTQNNKKYIFTVNQANWCLLQNPMKL